jgi:hypothetical protein
MDNAVSIPLENDHTDPLFSSTRGAPFGTRRNRGVTPHGGKGRHHIVRRPIGQPGMINARAKDRGSPDRRHSSTSRGPAMNVAMIDGESDTMARVMPTQDHGFQVAQLIRRIE